MRYFCCDERRRNAVRAHGMINGIDFLEVIDRSATVETDRQRILQIHFVKPVSQNDLLGFGLDNVIIEGGVRVTGVHAVQVAPNLVDGERVLQVRVNQPGDFSSYTLRLVDAPIPLDPMLSSIEFQFKIECVDDVDCRSTAACPPEPVEQPNIDYLAKDFASFRRLMLDRLSLLVPEWRGDNPADTGMLLVELLAYVGDHLSYQQDAVATEAYLGTARRRESVRRHARLVDYHMHDGNNARVWVCFTIAAGETVVVNRGALRAITRVEGFDARIAPDPLGVAGAESRIITAVRDGRAECFEPMDDAVLDARHNSLDLYTWGEGSCVLPRGATGATLAGDDHTLAVGDYLLLEEVRGPRSGRPADADPAHRHVVRLTSVQVGEDPVGGQFLGLPEGDPRRDEGVRITEIEWGLEDALPFPLCVSSLADESSGGGEVLAVSVARGNMVLFDHGRTVDPEGLATVPDPDARLSIPPPAGERCTTHEDMPLPPRFRPRLAEGPLTQAAPPPAKDVSAAAAFVWSADQVVPSIELVDDQRTWRAQRDLLASDAFAQEFVAEVDRAGVATLRFGDDVNGARPSPGTSFAAIYRVGNGVRGNIGAESIFHTITPLAEIVAVRNPLPARRGAEPETIEHVRQTAPAAFRVSERAVTPEDYAEVAARHAEVQRAVATLRWTGSWRTLFLTVDRLGGRAVESDETFVDSLRRHLERYRLAGHDVEIRGPRYVPLEIDLDVCVLPEYFRADVRGALLEVLSNRESRDGRRGLFHPDKFTFQQPVFVSRLYEAAQAVPGVSSVLVTRFQRLGVDDPDPLAKGMLEIDRLEIAQLDNDPNFPERGVLRLTMGGGR